MVFSDIACPWATVVVLRLRAARAALGAGGAPPIIHLAHPLELMHDRPLARRVIDAEIPLCAAAAPEFGWSVWQGRLDEYPASSLLAVEAVQAARRQSEAAAEELDLALRTALIVDSRCITIRRVILGGGVRLSAGRRWPVGGRSRSGCRARRGQPSGGGRASDP